MIYIDKTIFPHCFVEEKRFEWGEPYINMTPIFNLSINPGLSDIEFTIEILGKNNFKNNLDKLYNILINKEEHFRLVDFNEHILDREFLIGKILNFINENTNKIAPWDNEFKIFGEEFYLEMIKDDLKKSLKFDRKIY
ncbi:hypothetical protein ASG22_05745 [Chryseobacterium sp. Leaf405]|uniref:hypothetical protein n=1 Tax=Chryseobacterium sp. Leaf405 TaxID=1736367 RepID=UPI0006FB0B9C|nr:hypothetical protein [Chryseobacterium sp. Leaf405]KQT26172.1 hypothetical protein ASG22_05745 [Chryseobacterium sp. Leaf405]